ncbi:MAG: hypothetical protein ACKVOK_11445 [Flavobacteriales bacterium]
MSDTYYTVAVFTYPTEVIVPRITLETAGIECITKDEETITANPMLSNAVGGIKLQVKEQDFQKAVAILKEAGVEIFQVSDTESIWVLRLEKLTSRIPLLGKYSLEKRMMFILGVFIIAVSVYLYIKSRPDYYNSLIGQIWCVKQISIHNKINWVPPSNTFEVDGGHIVLLGSFDETMMLHSDGSYDLSNIYRDSIAGYWKLDGNQLELFGADTLGEILDRVYEIELDRERRVLKSLDTKIILTSEDYGFFN